MLVNFVIPGMSFALSAVSTPGPFTAYLINNTLRLGWRRSAIILLSPLIVDTPIILTALLFLSTLQAIIPDLIRLIQIVGGIVLLWIAWGSWQQFRAGAMFGAGEAKPDSDTPGQLLRNAMLINLLSPGPYLFWATVNGPLLLKALNVSVLHGAAFLIAFYGTFLSGLGLLAYVFASVGRANPRITRGLMLLTIVLLLYFGVRLILEGLLGSA